MVGKSWDVFTKRVLVEKHISDVMFEISGRPRHSLIKEIRIKYCIKE